MSGDKPSTGSALGMVAFTATTPRYLSAVRDVLDLVSARLDRTVALDLLDALVNAGTHDIVTTCGLRLLRGRYEGKVTPR